MRERRIVHCRFRLVRQLFINFHRRAGHAGALTRRPRLRTIVVREGAAQLSRRSRAERDRIRALAGGGGEREQEDAIGALSTLALDLVIDILLEREDTRYKLAEANGLSAQSGVSEGQVLRIPVGVQKNTHNANTFKPYDPAEVLGETAPTTPKPAKGNKCGAFGAILLVVIAVAVTAIVAGPASTFFSSLIAGPTATAAAATAATAATAAATATGATAAAAAAAGAAASAAALGTTAVVGGAIAGGAVAGALGSIASQGFGVLSGIQDKFSWKAVGMAAISGAISGGLGRLGGPVGKFLGADKLGSNMIRGALANATGQSIGVATRLQDKFDWAGVAAAGLSAGALGIASRTLGQHGIGVKPGLINPDTPRDAGFYGNQALSGMAGAIAGAAARTLTGGTSFGDNILAALPDVIGSTVGNLLADPVVAAIEEARVRRTLDKTGGIDTAPIVLTAQERAELGLDSDAEPIEATESKTDIELFLENLFAGSAYGEGEILLAGRNSRARIGGNGGPPLTDPRTGQVLGIPIINGPLGPAWAPLDGFLDLTGPANRLQGDLLQQQAKSLRAELLSLDPNWRDPGSIRATGPESLQSQLNTVTHLRSQRAFLRYHKLGDLAPLQVETLRVYQGFVDQGFGQAIRLSRAGELRIPNGWSKAQAIGAYTDTFARVRMRSWYGANGVSEGAGRAIAVNRRQYNQPEGGFRIPDVRVGGVVYDATLSSKGPLTPQVRGYFGAPSTSMVVIVRPSAVGKSYFIPRGI